MKRYKLTCDILTPIHIGSGDEISPFDYVVVEEDGCFYRLNQRSFFRSLSEQQREKFDAIPAEDLLKIRAFIVENFVPDKHASYEARMLETFQEEYLSKIGDINNQLLIHTFTGAESNHFIPGSSIKGAIRTAVLDAIREEKRITGTVDDRKIEADLLEASNSRGFLDPQRDPFRTLKVTDSPMPENTLLVGKVVNFRPKRNDAKEGVSFFVEAAAGRIFHDNEEEWERTFDIQIAIDEGLGEKKGFPVKLRMGFIKEACNSFYRRVMEQEVENLEGSDLDIDDCCKLLMKEPVEENEFLLRVGRFSGKDSVTLHDVKGRYDKGPPRSHNLFGGVCPMGWLKVKIQQQ